MKNKAALTTLHNISITYWSLSKHYAKKQCTSSELSPVQSSTSKSITSLRKEHLLRFQSNSTVISDVGVQNFKAISSMIIDQLQPKFTVMSIANEKQFPKAM